MKDLLIWAGCAVLLVGFLAFLYILIFKSKESNMPTAARGLGIALVGFILWGICAGTRSSHADIGSWLLVVQWVFGLLAAVGFLMMCSGLGGGD